MNNHPLKIIFAGTPDFAASALKALLEQGHDICAVYCQPDRPSGRGKKLIAGPVKQLALGHNIPVEQPLNFKQESSVEQLASYQADLMVVVAYGLLLPQAVLDTPRYGCVNIHGSILPRWRGAAPIQRAIEHGDDESGITIMQMDKGLDTGNMLLKLNCPIEDKETGSSLHDKLAVLGGQAINQYLTDFNPSKFDASNYGEVQDDTLACYAHKLSKQEAEIDWSEGAEQIERRIRAFNGWPVCFTSVNNKRLRVWQAQPGIKPETEQTPGTVTGFSKNGIEVVCGDQKTLLLTHLQPDGSKKMDAAALLNSRKEWFENSPVLGSRG
ncbi:methionyl-tRNA formyltransferase [Aliikangiella coralliicola]|uniref:Methionyl-tRNA formyltransferase n=1 Tax=Aliikangiella coralliicola TaxID=2592383 RepID=A0A545UGN1_9GAMM|nr:methionyl-tRNA formyltransferase [Aliikangiella coralliicola]TQV88628.1 methionyl-tRNA formyltransferase [Aliikangiella coralliicola]